MCMNFTLSRKEKAAIAGIALLLSPILIPVGIVVGTANGVAAAKNGMRHQLLHARRIKDIKAGRTPVDSTGSPIVTTPDPQAEALNQLWLQAEERKDGASYIAFGLGMFSMPDYLGAVSYLSKGLELLKSEKSDPSEQKHRNALEMKALYFRGLANQSIEGHQAQAVDDLKAALLLFDTVGPTKPAADETSSGEDLDRVDFLSALGYALYVKILYGTGEHVGKERTAMSDFSAADYLEAKQRLTEALALDPSDIRVLVASALVNLRVGFSYDVKTDSYSISDVGALVAGRELTDRALFQLFPSSIHDIFFTSNSSPVGVEAWANVRRLKQHQFDQQFNTKAFLDMLLFDTQMQERSDGDGTAGAQAPTPPATIGSHRLLTAAEVQAAEDPLLSDLFSLRLCLAKGLYLARKAEVAGFDETEEAKTMLEDLQMEDRTRCPRYPSSWYNVNADFSADDCLYTMPFRMDPTKETSNFSTANPHDFEEHFFVRPTWCQHCMGYIKKTSGAGFRCKTCKYECHAKCVESAKLFACQPHYSSNHQHTVKLRRVHRPHTCKQCYQTIMLMTHAYQCTSCGSLFHQDCAKLAHDILVAE